MNTCEWSEEPEDVLTYEYSWITSCNNQFIFGNGGNTSDNEFKFCPFCGGEIKEVEYKNE